MRVPGWVPVAVLLIVAIGSGLALWRLYRADEPAPLIGPPRSDYFLVDFELVSLDESGKEAFRVTGPLLSRHPHLGTLTIEQPRFLFPDEQTQPWTARADRAWASADGEQLRLDGDVALDGPDESERGPLAFRSESLSIYPKERRAASDALVEFTSAHSILEGRGFRADMQTRRFQLLNEVSGHYETPATTPRR